MHCTAHNTPQTHNHLSLQRLSCPASVSARGPAPIAAPPVATPPVAGVRVGAAQRLWQWLLLAALAVHGGEHEADVGGEQVVHLVAEGRLTEEAAAPDQVANRHVEVV